MLRDPQGVARRLVAEVGLTKAQASLYLRLLMEGSLPLSAKKSDVKRLEDEGMLILSGDGKLYIPVHPRLAIANHYRTWRESMVKEINERRMSVDRLILELIPSYEAATEKRLERRGG